MNLKERVKHIIISRSGNLRPEYAYRKTNEIVADMLGDEYFQDEYIFHEHEVGSFFMEHHDELLKTFGPTGVATEDKDVTYENEHTKMLSVVSLVALHILKDVTLPADRDALIEQIKTLTFE